MYMGGRTGETAEKCFSFWKILPLVFKTLETLMLWDGAALDDG